eukprot:GHVR01045287.1.p1 GENE.GHVR01045287.1~~GHVR01045287.1.p1  ORF type:complete len:227 (+),score=46.14 GHVR01045287.1:29-682(+)
MLYKLPNKLDTPLLLYGWNESVSTSALNPLYMELKYLGFTNIQDGISVGIVRQLLSVVTAPVVSLPNSAPNSVPNNVQNSVPNDMGGDLLDEMAKGLCRRINEDNMRSRYTACDRIHANRRVCKSQWSDEVTRSLRILIRHAVVHGVAMLRYHHEFSSFVTLMNVYLSAGITLTPAQVYNCLRVSLLRVTEGGECLALINTQIEHEFYNILNKIFTK